MHRQRRVLVVASVLAGAMTLQPLVAHAADSLTAAKAGELIGTYLTQRADRITAQAEALAGEQLTSVPTTGKLEDRLAVEAAELDGVREWTATTPSRGYRSAEVEVTVDEVTQGGPSTFQVTATERTKLYFGHDDPNAPKYEGYRLRHEFTFVDQNGSWTMADTTPEAQTGPPVPTQAKVGPRTATGPADTKAGPLPAANVATAAASRAVPPAGTVDKISSAVPGPPYNYTAMYNYALQYWDNYNPAYRGFGNDCTNFISQIMEAGGWDYDFGFYWDDTNWWYNSLNQTHSWAGAHNWGVFAQVNSQRTAPLDYVYQMLTTDVLQVNWDHPDENPDEADGNIDHTMIVTGIQGTPGAATEIYLTYHTTDRLNVAFWGWLLPQTEPRDVWYAHRT